jgi:zinc/manganese transport system substrate-binding protein
MRFLILSLVLSLASSAAYARLDVLTTLPDLKAIAAEVGGEYVKVDAIAKGTQDPHYIEAKPSFMVKARNADLLIAIGMELEIGYLPSIIRGARNPKIVKGQMGYLEVGPLVKPLEVPTTAISRAEGDVHPLGNPHVTLDPVRAGEIAAAIAKRLGELDPAHAAVFQANAEKLQQRLGAKTKEWQKRIEASGVKQVVTYHKTLTYFLDRFHLKAPVELEPKPGIPPTSGHTLEVIQTIKQDKIPLILVENYFDPAVTEKIRRTVPAVRAETVPVSVGGAPGVDTIDDLYETLVRAVEGRKK